MVSEEESKARQHLDEPRDFDVGLVVGENVESLDEAVGAAAEVALSPHRQAEPRGDACRRVRRAGRVVAVDRAAEKLHGCGEAGAVEGCEPRLLEQPRAHEVVVGKCGRLLEVALCLLGCCERRGPLACQHQLLGGLCPEHPGVVRVGRCLEGVEIVRRDHLHGLLFGLPCRVREVLGRGKVPCLPIGPRERLVRDLPQEILEEGILPALRRARVGLHRQHLLAHDRRKERLELGLAQP